MGRCNNKRAQQAAQALRNTPSRARFSKPPPSKKKSNGRGGGRGGGGGRGSNKTNGGRGGGRSSGRGGSGRHTAVIDKLSKRVQDKNRQTSSTSISRPNNNSRTSKHPMAGIDIAKLDQVTLSEDSIQLVTKLLTDLNVMESTESSSPTVAAADASRRQQHDQDDLMQAWDENYAGSTVQEVGDDKDKDVTSFDATQTANTAAGYTEYDQDFDDGYFQNDAGLGIEHDLTNWEGDDSDNDESDDVVRTDPLHNNNAINGDEADTETKDEALVRQTPLFLHLTTQLSFSEAHAERACRAIENWCVPEQTSDKTSSNGTSNGTTSLLDSDELGLAMDWLCLHLTEDELKAGFKPNPTAAARNRMTGSTKGGILLVGTGRTRPIPHASISVARPITSDQEWRDTLTRQARTVGFVRLGFHQAEAEQACDETKGTQQTFGTAVQDEAALRILLPLLEKETLGDSLSESTDTPPTAADLEFVTEEREQEIQALEAIYDDQFELRPSKNEDSNYDRYLLTITPNEELNKPARSEECKLHVLVRPGYPVLSAPLLLFTNPTLPPTLLRRINIAMIQEAHQNLAGEPVVFALVDFLSTNLFEMQKDFVREQRTKEMEAEQLRMRRAAGHNVGLEAVIEAQYENDGKIGRRQRQKLKAAEKSYDRASQLEVEDEERQLRNLKRRERIQMEHKTHRYTLAERAVQQREKDRIQEEAERSSRAAMNAAFNRGESADEARAAARKARKESLRDNGEDVSSEEDNEVNNVSTSGHDGVDEPENVQTTVEENEQLRKDDSPSIIAQDIELPQKKTQGATPQTMAFMERLRQFYQAAALEKSKRDESIDAVADQNGDEKKDSSDESDRNRFTYHLAEPKVANDSPSIDEEGTPESVLHVPAPVAVPSGDLADVMKDVTKTQTEQPWLISPEARVPAFESDPCDPTPEQIQERNQISKTLRNELHRKHQSSEEWGRKHPDFDHSGSGGKNSAKAGRSAQQFNRMMSQRQRLPAYVMKDEIVKTIAANQVTVISGDTGCGKTTQVPQLVLDDLIWNNRGAEASIVITQPRRISAIGVAERVAAERCERVGETSGYSIRLENKRSAKTRFLFCTTGILLRRLQCDPDLASVSHVFVDEVHERDINTDFLLIILKDLLSRRKSLKLVLMSATLNAETFSAYFAGCPTVSIPGRAHPVTENRLEDILQITGYEVPEGSDYARKTSATLAPRFSKSALRKMYYPKYDSKVISSLAIVDESVINYVLMAALLEYITLNEKEGAILVFLPGMMEITKAIEEMYKKEFFSDQSKVVVYPLHSSLTTSEQTAVFEVPPEGVRKIVVSTNIAETSITIEDVVFVIDAGRVKENRQDEVAQMPTLVECWVSRASAKQRRGRAGRVRPGVSYHMYSSHTYEHDMQEYQLPEMLRVGLEDLVLQVLLLDLGSPSIFLSKAVNPPSALAMRNSLKLLEGLGAVECEWGDDGARRKDSAAEGPACDTLQVASGLTALGFHLATLPVDPRVGKMMIYGALFGCIDPALTIAASMSARNPFMSPFDKRDEADAARKEFATEGSDHLTTLTAFNQWKEIRRTSGDRVAQSFLRDSFLSRMTLFQMEDLRRQFADLLKDIGFLPKNFRLVQSSGRGKYAGGRDQQSQNTKSNVANANADNVHLVKAILCAGLYPNIMVAPRPLVRSDGLSSDKEAGECAFHSLKGDVYLHPCTISFKEKRLDSRYCCYHEIVKTSKTYVRDCTTVSEFALLLFGGSLKVYHTHGVVTIDEWLKFRIAAKPATLVKHLRAQMESMLLKKIVSPEEDVTGSHEGRALIQAVSALLQREITKAVPDGSDIVRPWTGQNDSGRSRNNGRNRQGGRGDRSSSRGGGRSGGRGGRRGRGG